MIVTLTKTYKYMKIKRKKSADCACTDFCPFDLHLISGHLSLTPLCRDFYLDLYA